MIYGHFRLRRHLQTATAYDALARGRSDLATGDLRAACAIMQLVQARDGQSAQQAQIALSAAEIETPHALLPEVEGRTTLQKNPHPPNSLAWAGWIIAKLGGWDGYPRPKPA